MLYMLGVHPMGIYSQRLCYKDPWQQACLILLDAPAPPER